MADERIDGVWEGRSLSLVCSQGDRRVSQECVACQSLRVRWNERVSYELTRGEWTTLPAAGLLGKNVSMRPLQERRFV